MVGRIGGLLGGAQNGRAGDGPAAGGKDALRIFFSGDPEHLVEPVDAPVAERAVGVVEVVAETARVNAAVAGADRRRAGITAVERPQRGGAAPPIPIELFRHFHGGQWFLGTAAAVVDETADHADVANFAGADEVATADIVRRDAAVGADLDHPAGGARGVHHGAAFHDGVANGFFNVNVGAGFHGGDRRERVPVVGGADDRDIGLHCREALTIVLEAFRCAADAGRAVFHRRLKLPRIDVAQGDEFAVSAGEGFAEDIVAPPAAADEDGAKFLRAGFVGGADGKRERGERRGSGGTLEEGAAIHLQEDFQAFRPRPIFWRRCAMDFSISDFWKS